MPILKRETDVFPSNLFDDPEGLGPWQIAHVRSRQEKLLARHLTHFSVPFYLPQMEQVSRNNRRQKPSYLPLFAGYLFFRGGAEERLSVLKSQVAANILQVSDQEELHQELSQLFRLQSTGARFVPHPYLGPGDEVFVTEGVFCGYRGIVLREKSDLRLVVSISAVRQSVLVELHKESLAPVA